MSNSTHLKPSFDAHGLQPCHNPFNVVNQGHARPQFFPNVCLNNNKPPLPPMFQPNNSHANESINFSLRHIPQSIQMSTTSISEAPIMPRDPEMLKNIDLLSSFVVKEGLSFEKMTREKEVNDPKFRFLFDSEPGTEAAIGKVYYEWKKNALQATFHPRYQCQTPTSLSNQICCESQIPLSSSNHCYSSQIQATKNEIYTFHDQDSIFSGETDMDIEGMYSLFPYWDSLNFFKSIFIPYTLKI